MMVHNDKRFREVQNDYLNILRNVKQKYQVVHVACSLAEICVVQSRDVGRSGNGIE